MRLKKPVVDRHWGFVAARGRPDRVLVAVDDLKVFFSILGKNPVEWR